nr:MAG TPA: hypothetical protein [Caudoviricetes sp.]
MSFLTPLFFRLKICTFSPFSSKTQELQSIAIIFFDFSLKLLYNNYIRFRRKSPKIALYKCGFSSNIYAFYITRINKFILYLKMYKKKERRTLCHIHYEISTVNTHSHVFA